MEVAIAFARSRRLDYVAGLQTAPADPRNACRIKDVAYAYAQLSNVVVGSCDIAEA
jgi:hypothetical protein